MADISKVKLPDNVTYNLKDSGAVRKTGDTMTGALTMAGTDIQLRTTGSSSDDSSDIAWYYGNGYEKCRLWTNNSYTSKSGLNYRLYKSDGTSLYNGTIPLADGTGASGTWGISVSGNAATATKATQDGDGNIINTTYYKTSSLGATTFKVTRGASISTNTASYWAAMVNSGQAGSPILPTANKWWHILSMDWNSDTSNWISQLAIATQDGNGVWWRRNDASGTNIDSSTWHRLAEGDTNGNANTANVAVKLQTARSIALGTDLQGSANFDGSGNITISASSYQCSVNGGNKANYPWHRIAYVTGVSGTYTDKDAIFVIRRGYAEGEFGIIKVSLRTNNTSQACNISAKWVIRSGFAANDIVIAQWGVTGNAVYADIFLKCSTYPRTTVYQIYGSRSWTLVNSSEVNDTTTTDKKTSGEVYKDVATAATEIHNQAYTTTTEASDRGNVNYANSAGTATDSTKLPLAGGTMTGSITCTTSGANFKYGNITIYGGGTNGGINSMLIGDDVTIGDCNKGGCFGMKSTGSNAGFRFYNSSGTSIGGLQSTNGTLQWFNSSETAYNVSYLTATPTSGQVVITDGTTGGIKSSGYTIAKSVPSNAVFTDANVTQTEVSDLKYYEVCLSDSTSGSVKKSSNLKFLPSYGRLEITSSSDSDTNIFSIFYTKDGSSNNLGFNVAGEGNCSCATLSTRGGVSIGEGLELGMASASTVPFIDFHWQSTDTDYTARLIQRVENTIDFMGKNSATWGTARAASFSSQSSIYVKENISDITDEAAKRILQLRPVNFDYKGDGNKNQRGLIAEEVMDIMPDMVIIPKGYTEYDPIEPWNTPCIDYSKFVPYLIKMVQIQQQEIDELKGRI